MVGCSWVTRMYRTKATFIVVVGCRQSCVGNWHSTAFYCSRGKSNMHSQVERESSLCYPLFFLCRFSHLHRLNHPVNIWYKKYLCHHYHFRRFDIRMQSTLRSALAKSRRNRVFEEALAELERKRKILISTGIIFAKQYLRYVKPKPSHLFSLGKTRKLTRSGSSTASVYSNVSQECWVDKDRSAAYCGKFLN